MKNIDVVLILMLFLSGCATNMAYLNTQKPAEELQRDKDDCQSIVDASDFKDPDLKKNKFNQCMKDKGYKVVSEDEAEKIQGFKGLWIKPGADFKAYEVIFIDKVDLTQVIVDNAHIPDTKVSNDDINNLGEEMLRRFSKILSVVMPVITDKEDMTDKRVLYLSLKLDKISQTNVGANVILQAVGQLTPVPFLPDSPQGAFAFKGEIKDYFSKEKLITISDECKEDKNASLVGTESFSHWQHGYNIIDYWADHLAALLAKVRDQKYKSQLGIKLF